MSTATIEQQLRNLEKGYMELRAENQRYEKALRGISEDRQRTVAGLQGWAREALRSEQPLPDPTNREWRGTPKALRSEQ